jgi:hypothetical protein
VCGAQLKQLREKWIMKEIVSQKGNVDGDHHTEEGSKIDRMAETYCDGYG